jgi:hypothetical protein
MIGHAGDDRAGCLQRHSHPPDTDALNDSTPARVLHSGWATIPPDTDADLSRVLDFLRATNPGRRAARPPARRPSTACWHTELDRKHNHLDQTETN